MRFLVRVTRVQTAERTITAADDEAALKKIRAELEQPYGFLGRWETAAVDAEIVEAQTTVTTGAIPSDGPMLLSVADAAKHLGISRASLYELVNQGAIDHVQLGRRRLISREALARFVEANTRNGR
jgi:excisionase family DNA binding protein